ncbi:MAG: L-threonine 3-dehydrogenase [Planctomycetes bacterium]|nr:L-threonine 3-dehydrogenase [Planctomycetota bacterium]
MRAAILRGKEDVAVLDVPVPAPGPGEVVLSIDAALTCGTDAKVFRRGYHARMLRPPCAIGHEYAGTVAAAGAGVSRFREGDRVVGANSAPCGACPWCRKGRESLCDDLLFVNGAFAERLLVPARVVERNLHPLPPGCDPWRAAAVEPIACVLKGIEAAAPEAGERVLVLGSGSIALFFASELRARGVECVVLCRSGTAAATARAMGAASSVVPLQGEDLRDALRAAGEFDVVVEAAGAAETTEAAPALARKGGRVLLFGGCAADVRVSVDPSRLHYEEISVLSSFHHTPRHVRAALDAVASGRIDPRPVTEEPVGLDGLAAALRGMCARTIRGKVPVDPKR